MGVSTHRGRSVTIAGSVGEWTGGPPDVSATQIERVLASRVPFMKDPADRQISGGGVGELPATVLHGCAENAHSPASSGPLSFSPPSRSLCLHLSLSLSFKYHSRNLLKSH